jgi:hypothetical protein
MNKANNEVMENLKKGYRNLCLDEAGVGDKCEHYKKCHPKGKVNLDKVGICLYGCDPEDCEICRYAKDCERDKLEKVFIFR